jgi:zinc transporter 1
VTHTHQATEQTTSPVEIKHVHSGSRDGAEDSTPSLSGHPAFTRASLVQVANDIASQVARSPSPTRNVNKSRRSTSRPPQVNGAESSRRALSHVRDEDEEEHSSRILDETAPLLVSPGEASGSRTVTPPSSHESHGHGHGHSHGGSMNMHALLLHVLGDALGNVGVIATGLVIWLTEWRYKFYFDPLVSLLITVIIFSSALPLGEYL